MQVLSGGELQRFAIAVVVVQQADVYMFDEPSSYLDVKQRLKAATTIRSIVGAEAAGLQVGLCGPLARPLARPLSSPLSRPLSRPPGCR